MDTQKITSKAVFFTSVVILIAVIASLTYAVLNRNVLLMFNNHLSEQVVVTKILVNGTDVIFSGQKFLPANSRSFQSGAGFDFKYFGSIKSITLEGDTGKEHLLLSCKTHEKDSYNCFYNLSLRSKNAMTCGCDNPSDFK